MMRIDCLLRPLADSATFAGERYFPRLRARLIGLNKRKRLGTSGTKIGAVSPFRVGGGGKVVSLCSATNIIRPVSEREYLLHAPPLGAISGTGAKRKNKHARQRNVDPREGDYSFPRVCVTQLASALASKGSGPSHQGSLR